MCNSGKVTRKDDPRTLIQYCVRSILDLVKQGVNILDEAKEKEKEKREKYSTSKGTAVKALLGGDKDRDRDSPSLSPLTLTEEKAGKGKEDEILLRQTVKLQMEIFDTLVALRQNDIAWNLLQGKRERDSERDSEMDSERDTDEVMYCVL